MTKENAKGRITKKINRIYADESVAVRQYLIELVLLTWENLELDYGACHDDGRPYTSTENLNFAVETIGAFELEEARREAK